MPKLTTGKHAVVRRKKPVAGVVYTIGVLPGGAGTDALTTVPVGPPFLTACALAGLT
jgi:hypothetical protein